MSSQGSSRNFVKPNISSWNMRHKWKNTTTTMVSEHYQTWTILLTLGFIKVNLGQFRKIYTNQVSQIFVSSISVFWGPQKHCQQVIPCSSQNGPAAASARWANWASRSSWQEVDFDVLCVGKIWSLMWRKSYQSWLAFHWREGSLSKPGKRIAFKGQLLKELKKSLEGGENTMWMRKNVPEGWRGERGGRKNQVNIWSRNKGSCCTILL